MISRSHDLPQKHQTYGKSLKRSERSLRELSVFLLVFAITARLFLHTFPTTRIGLRRQNHGKKKCDRQGDYVRREVELPERDAK